MSYSGRDGYASILATVRSSFGVDTTPLKEEWLNTDATNDGQKAADATGGRAGDTQVLGVCGTYAGRLNGALFLPLVLRVPY